MFISVEPAGFFMHTVKLVFDLDRPNAEDSLVREYLAQHGLEPRYRWDEALEGRRGEVLQFGGCYLGSHLNAVGQIQRRVVEEELLSAEIDRLLEDLPSREPLSLEERRALIGRLAAQFYRESSFQANEQGELAAALDREEVREAARRELER